VKWMRVLWVSISCILSILVINGNRAQGRSKMPVVGKIEELITIMRIHEFGFYVERSNYCSADASLRGEYEERSKTSIHKSD